MIFSQTHPDPKEEARFFLQQAALNHPKVVIFLGFGNGFHVSELLKNPPAELEHVLVIEKDQQAFNLALQNSSIRSLVSDPRVHFHVGFPSSAFRQVIYDFLLPLKHLYFVRAIDIVPFWPAFQDARARTYYEEVMKFLQEGLEYRHRVARCDPEDSLEGFRNLLANASSVFSTPNLDSLRNVCRGLPGIVIASGPSLDFALPYLSGQNKKAVLVGCTSNAQMLVDQKINPHFLVAIERGKEFPVYFQNLTPPDETRFLAFPLIDPENYPHFKGKSVSLYRDIQLFKWFPFEGERHYFGGSAALLAFYSLAWMGCDPIILVGQDLAYARDSDRTHGKGLHEEGFTKLYADTLKASARIPVKGNNGEPILTQNDWLKFRDTYERFLKNWKGTCINAIPADYGLEIPGAVRMDVREAFEKYLSGADQPVATILKKALPVPSAEEKLKKEDFFRDYLEKTVRELQELKNHSGLQARTINESIIHQKVDMTDHWHTEYQKLHEGSSAKALLYDMTHGPDLDLMAAFHELPRKNLSSLNEGLKKLELLREGFKTMELWCGKIVREIEAHYTATRT